MGVRPACHRRGLGTALLASRGGLPPRAGRRVPPGEDARPVAPGRGVRTDAALLRGTRVRAARGAPRALGAEPGVDPRQAAVSERSPETLVWDFLRGAMTTKALAIVADLGIAEALADGPKPVAELAARRRRRPRCPPPLASRARERRRLRRGSSRRLRQHGRLRAAPQPGLDGVRAAVRRPLLQGGRGPRRRRTYGRGHVSGSLRQRLLALARRAPGERAVFDRAMAGERWRKAERLAELDWRDGETVVDVGGGNGALLVDLVGRRSGLRGIVFDLPETNRDEDALGDDIEFVEGELLRERAARRRVRALRDHPRLGRRARREDPRERSATLLRRRRAS